MIEAKEKALKSLIEKLLSMKMGDKEEMPKEEKEEGELEIEIVSMGKLPKKEKKEA